MGVSAAESYRPPRRTARRAGRNPAPFPRAAERLLPTAAPDSTRSPCRRHCINSARHWRGGEGQGTRRAASDRSKETGSGRGNVNTSKCQGQDGDARVGKKRWRAGARPGGRLRAPCRPAWHVRVNTGGFEGYFGLSGGFCTIPLRREELVATGGGGWGGAGEWMTGGRRRWGDGARDPHRWELAGLTA